MYHLYCWQIANLSIKWKSLSANIMSYIIGSGKDVMFESHWSSFSINQSQKFLILWSEKALYKYFKAPMALLYGYPENTLTAPDSPKIEKEIKLCYKCFKSRINNVPLKSSLCNLFDFCLPDGGNMVGEIWWNFG